METVAISATILSVASLSNSIYEVIGNVSKSLAEIKHDDLKAQIIALQADRRRLEQWAKDFCQYRTPFEEEVLNEIDNTLEDFGDVAGRMEARLQDFAIEQGSKDQTPQTAAISWYLSGCEKGLSDVIDVLQRLNFLLPSIRPPLSPSCSAREDVASAVQLSTMADSEMKFTGLSGDIAPTAATLQGLWRVCLEAMSPLIKYSTPPSARLERIQSRLRIWGMDLFRGELDLDAVVQDNLSQMPKLLRDMSSPLVEIALTQGHILDRWTLAEQSSTSNPRETIEATSFQLRRVLLDSSSLYELVEAWTSRQAQNDHGMHNEESDMKYLGQAVELLYTMLPIIRGLKVQRILSLEKLQPLEQSGQAKLEVGQLSSAPRTRSTLWDNVPLKNGATSIRIFTIESRDDGANIQCTFRTVCLSERPNFVAISYTWDLGLRPNEKDTGDALSTQKNDTITCNGFEIRVPNNLYHALSKLWSSRPHDVEYWADALCIDQSNMSERSQQVAAMAKIFESASEVVIWLGPGTQSSTHAIEFVERISGLTTEAMEAFAYGEPSDIDDGTRSKLATKEYWEALEVFFSRSWFKRLWSVQEAILAKRLVVMCGDQIIEWEKLCLTSRYLKRFADSLAHLCSTSFVDTVYLDSPARLETSRSYQFWKSKHDLLYNLIIFRKYLCVDVRDTVFSLLDIARLRSTHQSQHALPVPDYTVSAADVFHQTALHILDTSDNLLLLAHAEGESSGKTKKMPSWVPDWSVRKSLGLAYTEHKSFEADYGRPRFIGLRYNDRILAIETAMVDRVSMVGETKESVLLTGQYSQWLAIIASLQGLYGQATKEIFWRTLLTDIVPTHRGILHPAPSMFERLFESWLLNLLRTTESRNEEGTPGKTGDSMSATAQSHGLQWLCDILTRAESTEEIEVRAARFKTVYCNTLHVRLFRTAEGRLGIGSASIEDGDMVCIASGSRVPLILRQRQAVEAGLDDQALRYELVGTAYVHGCMHGEALPRSETDFRIVELV